MIVKKSAAFILVLIFALQTFHAGFVTIWFYANRNYVAEKLCINKSRPMLKCNGKCFLSKKLKEAEKENQDGLPYSIKQQEEASLCVIATIAYTIHFVLQDTAYPTAAVNAYTFSPNTGIFHPPAALHC